MEVPKCEEHSGVCARIINVEKQIKEIRDRLWYIMLVTTIGAVGVLVNILVTHANGG